MKSAFMVQRPEKLFIHSDTGPPTGRWKDDEFGRRASLMESLSFFSIILEILFDFPPSCTFNIDFKNISVTGSNFCRSLDSKRQCRFIQDKRHKITTTATKHLKSK